MRCATCQQEAPLARGLCRACFRTMRMPRPALTRESATRDLQATGATVRFLERETMRWTAPMPLAYFVATLPPAADEAGAWRWDRVCDARDNGALPDWDAIGPDVIRAHHAAPVDPTDALLAEELAREAA